MLLLLLLLLLILLLLLCKTVHINFAQGNILVCIWKMQGVELNFLQTHPYDDIFTVYIVEELLHSSHHFLLFNFHQVKEMNKSASFYEILFRN